MNYELYFLDDHKNGNNRNGSTAFDEARLKLRGLSVWKIVVDVRRGFGLDTGLNCHA